MFETGPYVQAALLCEKVLEEKDGILSLIRVVDRFTHSVRGAAVPEQMPPVPVNLTLLVALKSGEARGRNTMRLRMRDPSGLVAGPEMSVPVFFEGENRGINVRIALAMQLSVEGLYWFEVLLEDQLLTKIPLQIIYAPISTGQAPPSG